MSINQILIIVDVPEIDIESDEDEDIDLITHILEQKQPSKKKGN